MWKKDSPEPPETTPRGHRSDLRPKNPAGPNNDRSVIGTTITIKGEVSGGQDMLINGCVEGRLSLPGHTVTVGKEGRIKAEMLAKVIQIGGFVEGSLQGEKTIRLCETGRVRGSLTAPEIVLAEGCKYKGSVDTGDGAKDSEA